MSETLKRLCAWSGPATVAVALVGWLIAGVLPLPLGSSSTTDEVVAFYGHDTRVLIGLVIAQLGVCLVFPLIALITLAMLRIEGRTPLLTIIQAVTGAATGVLLLMPMLLMAVIAFRPDRTPELTVTLNDIAWLLFLTPIAPFMIQNIAIGTAILGDKRSLLPRWVGYFNFWVAAAFIPDVLAFFFHDGAFSWRGVFVFWLALFAYAAFLIVMGVVLRNADLDTRTES
ncbi:lipoprotein [Mycolicibacterium aromaticivorans JS19b1 = JCM 16368]|uniref:Lipoprotein n=1 Tax=Mycolicibacterium aromaticivorans JS19b1 = JCM 16368 TaxID=1440774 RepID=A0A064CCB5_9MYCO